MHGMDSKGGSLPLMLEPRSPVSMKQSSDPLGGGGRKGRVEVGADSPLAMDKTTTQLAATPQDGVLPRMQNGHGPTHGHSLEQLKDLTSRVLNNGEQPKHCAATVTGPQESTIKGVEPAPQGPAPAQEVMLKFPKRAMAAAGGNKPVPSGRCDSSACFAEDGERPTVSATVTTPEGNLGALSPGRKRKRRPVKKRAPQKALAVSRVALHKRASLHKKASQSQLAADQQSADPATTSSNHITESNTLTTTSVTTFASIDQSRIALKCNPVRSWCFLLFYCAVTRLPIENSFFFASQFHLYTHTHTR